MAEATIAVEKINSKAIISIAGVLAGNSVSSLRDQLSKLLAQKITELVLDLRSATMVDSMAIGLMIAANNSLSQSGGRLTVINASEDLLDLFKQTGLTDFFSVSGVEPESDNSK